MSKRIFYISNKYKDVEEILKKVPNSSEYICQAILEKSKKNTNVNIEDIEDLFKKYLKEINISKTIKEESEESIRRPIAKNIDEPIDIEKSELLLSILDSFEE